MQPLIVRFRYITAIILLLSVARTASSQILAEDFRNTGCTNCRDGDDAYEAFLIGNPDFNVTLVYFHDNAPAPKDPFFLASKNDVNMRVAQYGVIGDPTLFVQGTFVVNDGDKFFAKGKSFTTDLANGLKNQPPTAHIALSTSKTGNTTFNIHADITGTLFPLSGSGVKLYLMVVESNLFYINTSSPGYGRTPNDLWNNIFRKMLPDGDGTDAFTVTGSNSFDMVLDTAGTNWNLGNITLVAFLQDSKEVNGNSFPIYAIAKLPMGSLGVGESTTAGTSLGVASQNPFSVSTSLPLELSKPAYVRAIVTNLLGQQVAVIADGMITEPKATLSFRPYSLSAGMYYIMVTIDGNAPVTRQIVYQP